MPSFTILIVEDKESEQTLMAYRLRKVFGESLVLLQAETLSEAVELFRSHHASLDLIILDACVPGDKPTTIPLVRMWRAGGFTKPMIAASSERLFCRMLVEAGCDEGCSKEDAPNVAKRLLLGT